MIAALRGRRHGGAGLAVGLRARLRSWAWVALAALCLAAGVAPAMAQEGPPAAADSTVQPADPPAAAVGGASDPLPAPRTDRAYTHVFLAFGIAWLLILGYVLALNRRIATAERDMARLAERGG